jgi:hypothetical protein
MAKRKAFRDMTDAELQRPLRPPRGMPLWAGPPDLVVMLTVHLPYTSMGHPESRTAAVVAALRAHIEQVNAAPQGPRTSGTHMLPRGVVLTWQTDGRLDRFMAYVVAEEDRLREIERRQVDAQLAINKRRSRRPAKKVKRRG